MRLLLDTQIFIWHAVELTRINPDAYRMIKAPANDVYVSHVSLFEIAIKQRLGKLPTLPYPVPRLEALATASGFILLPISSDHIAAYNSVPLLPDHRDPFDRLLPATAFAEDMPIISADGHFPMYAPLVTVIAG